MTFKRSLLIPLVVFLMMALFLGFGFRLDNAKILPSALLDKPVPEFRLHDLMLKEVVRSPKDLLGEVALINVWGTWCPNCIVEHPELLRISKEEDIKVYGINYRDNNAKAIEWLERFEDPYIFSVVDSEGKLAIDLGVYGAPETFVIDKKGIIRKRHVGPLNFEIWTNEIEPIVDYLKSF